MYIQVYGFWQTHRVVYLPLQLRCRIILSQKCPHASSLWSVPPCTLSPSDLWTVFCPYSVAFSRMFNKGNRVIVFCIGLISFSKMHLSHPFYRMNQEFVPFYCWMIFHFLALQAIGAMTVTLPWVKAGCSRGKNDAHTVGLVVLWILVFFVSLPVTVYFSDSSNSCCVILSRFYKGNPQESLSGGSVWRLT